MKFEKLEDKLYKIFYINRSANRIMITYRYPTIMQSTILKYELVPITDDEDIEIIFSIVSSHFCLSSAELYIDIQPVEDIETILDLEYNDVADRDTRLITQMSKQVGASSPCMASVPLNTDSKDTETCGCAEGTGEGRSRGTSAGWSPQGTTKRG